MINLNRLKKDEILWLFNHRCKHRHNYIEHYPCYVQENPHDSPLSEKIGHLDIETNHLKANWGIVLSYCIKIDGKNEILGRTVTPQEMRRGVYDKEILKDIVRDIREFDTVTTYYGEKFDIPFLRTRCLMLDLDFPLYKEVKHRDIYHDVKRNLCLHSRRLQTVCEALGIHDKGTHPIKTSIWLQATGGEPRSQQKALEWIYTHNVEDVVSLEKVYHRLLPYTARKKGSI